MSLIIIPDLFPFTTPLLMPHLPNPSIIIYYIASGKVLVPADAVRRMEAKLQTEEGKEIYRQRKKIVEPVFGQIKSNSGFRRFRLRGLDKAGGEWTLVCLAQNVKKIHARIMAK